MPPPAILGHEGAGDRRLGRAARCRGLSVGDRVIGSFIPACGHCWFCLHDESNLCENTYTVMMNPRATRGDGTALSTMTGLGTFADMMTVDEMSVVKVDTELPDEYLALIGCGVTTGTGAALFTARGRARLDGRGHRLRRRRPGRHPGCPHRRRGAHHRHRPRRAEARQRPRSSAPPRSSTRPTATRSRRCRRSPSGRGVDYAFEVIGTPATVVQAFNMARNGGAAVAVGVSKFDQNIEIPSFPLVLGEKRLLGCVYGSAQVRRDFPKLVSLVEQGKLDLGSMVSRTMHLDDINDAFKAMQAGEVIRSVLV